MKKEQHYTQCHLVSGNNKYVAWIPSVFAEKNKYITIDSMPGVWQVVETFKTLPGSILENQRKSWKGFENVLDT